MLWTLIFSRDLWYIWHLIIVNWIWNFGKWNKKLFLNARLSNKQEPSSLQANNLKKIENILSVTKNEETYWADNFNFLTANGKVKVWKLHWTIKSCTNKPCHLATNRNYIWQLSSMTWTVVKINVWQLSKLTVVKIEI